MKIALSGSAGTGRSTIAMRIGQAIGYKPLTNLAKSILKEEGFKYGSEITVEQFLATPERQMLLYDHKRTIEAKYEDFVVDRSWIDHAAYAIIGFYDSSSFNISSYLDDCRLEIEKYDIIFHIPWGRKPLEPNGTRTINPWFQFVVDAVICRIANLWKVELINVPSDLDNNECVEWILNLLKEKNPELQISDWKQPVEDIDNIK